MNGNRKSRKNAAVLLGAGFGFVTTLISYLYWKTFSYKSFDAAFYAQALSNLWKNEWNVSILDVPLLGNHFDVILFLISPLYWVFQHPILLVAIQNFAIGFSSIFAYRISGRIGFNENTAFGLSMALLIAPAAGYIALHEFHPEAFSIPLILWMIDAKQRSSLREYLIAILLLLGCKINMTLIIVAFCCVFLWLERRKPFKALFAWNILPVLFCLLWVYGYLTFIQPNLNRGNVDFLALYSRFGNSPAEIVEGVFVKYDVTLKMLSQSVRGTLVAGLWLPFLGLPLLRPRWLIVVMPVFMQHLLSWRSSEWQIYFHYAAPILPFMWLGLCESVQKISLFPYFKPNELAVKQGIIVTVILACGVAQLWIGPLVKIWHRKSDLDGNTLRVELAQEMLKKIPPSASVTAGLPYLSHLSNHTNLISLHHILKGTQTLGDQLWVRPSSDYLFIDFMDDVTFDPVAGFYHPGMLFRNGNSIPPSDVLLYKYVRDHSWDTIQINEMLLMKKVPLKENDDLKMEGKGFELDQHTQLVQIKRIGEKWEPSTPLKIEMIWKADEERKMIPWMVIDLIPRQSSGKAVRITKGLCGLQDDGLFREVWNVALPNHLNLRKGEYAMVSRFFNRMQSEGVLQRKRVPDPGRLLLEIELGTITVSNSNP